MINYKLIFFCIAVLTFTTTHSQDCGCDATFMKADDNGGINFINGENAPFDAVQPGGTICIETGDYQAIRLRNIKGSEEDPITIKNCGGIVTLHDGMLVLGSQYLKITGTGHSETKYGFTVVESEGTGMELKDLTSDVEVEFIEIGNVGFAGLMAKTDPICGKPETYRENFTFNNLIVHDVYIHHTEGEGIYIGNTSGSKTCSDSDGKKVAHLLKNVKVYDNIIHDTGWDGFQLNLAVEDVEVYNNIVYGYGIERKQAQNFGWSIGGGTKGRFYNNAIIQKDEYKIASDDDSDFISSGAQIISTEDTYFYNNIVINSERHGLFIHNRTSREDLDFSEGYYFVNNTIVGAGISCIFLNTQSTSGPSDDKNDWNRGFYNNLLVGPKVEYENINFWKDFNENYIDFNKLSMRDASLDFIKNNLYVKDIAAVGFVNPLDSDLDSEDFKILETSDAVDAGMDVSSEFGVSIDFGGFSRPVGAGFDIGAWEFGASNIAPVVETTEYLEIEGFEPFDLDGTSSTDPDGTIDSYLWEMIEGPEEVTIQNSSSATATVTDFKEGQYLFKLTVTDNDGGSSSSITEVLVIKVLGLEDQLDNSLIKNIFPNPLMNGIITFNLEFDKKTRASIYICDMSGKKMATIQDSKVFQQGLVEYTWQPNVPSNTYVLTIEGDRVRSSRLFVVH